MLTVFHELTACLSDSCMGTAGLVSGHETAKFRTNDVASHQKCCQARWALNTWCLVHVGHVDRAARVAYLNRSDQFWTLRRQLVEQSDALHLSSLRQTVLLRISTALAFALCPWYVALAVLVAEPWLTHTVCLRASRPDSLLLTLCWRGLPSTHEQTQSEQLRDDRVLFGQRAFTPGFESIIIGQYLPLAAPQESFLLWDAMQSSAQALRLGLEQVRHILPWDVGEHHVGLLANIARLSFHQWFVNDMEISGDWGPIWLPSWLALASWPGTGVCDFSPSACGEWWDLLPRRGSLSWASLNMVASFFVLALPFRSFEHPFSRRWLLDHLRCALWHWLLLCHLPLRLVNGDNSLGTAKRLRCRLVLILFQLILTLQLSPVQLVKVR